jgi:MFS family permease
MVIPPALKSKPYLLYWIGQLISVAGSQMQIWALYWHLRTLSDNPLVVSGVGLARILPVFLLSLAAGVAADRFNRRTTAIFTQFALAGVAVILGMTTFFGEATIWILFGLVTAQSIASAFDVPARQALIPSLVPREHLANAYSLNSIAAKVGGILGPAVCGLVIAYLGLQWAYWINAITFLAVILALNAMGDVPSSFERKALKAPGTLQEMQAGIEFIKNSPIISSVILLDFFGTFFASAKTLLPFVATDILHVGPIQYGWLSASQSIGTVLVGIYLSQKAHLRRQGILISTSVAGLGLASIMFGLSNIFWMTMLALILVGMFDGVSTIIRNTIRQLQTPDAMRGRMMSITQIFTKGGPQLGEVEAGLVAQVLGVPFAIISGGAACVLAAWLVVKRTPQLWSFDGTEPVRLEGVAN